MHSSVKIMSILSLLALGLASPAPDSLRLDNGQETKDAALASRDRGVALEARDVDCRGSAFCERLGGSCDDAFRQIQPNNVYRTGDNKGASGTCSGTCGVFVSGGHCSATGAQLQASYQNIRKKGCNHCGRETMSNGCMIKIDRVTGC